MTDGPRSCGLDTMSAALPKAQGYHRWVFSKARPFLGSRVLEVGGGYGIYLDMLKDRELAVSVDISPECTDMLRRRFSSFPGVVVKNMDVTDMAAASELREMNLDSAICFNVLEHVEDDRSFLEAVRSVLPVGGKLVVVVPAHPFLYGSLDRAGGHFRRYTGKSLRERLVTAGFEVLDARYFNSLGALGWFAASRLFQQKRLSSWATEAEILLFEKLVLPVSKVSDALFNKFFGQSLVAVGEVTPSSSDVHE